MRLTKWIVSFTGIVAVLLAAPLFSQSASPSPAQSPRPAAAGSGNLRAIATNNFYFLELQDPLIYPETNLGINPAILSRIRDTLLRNDTGFLWNENKQTQVRTDESVGALNGTHDIVNQSMDLSESVALYLALEPLQSTPRLGLELSVRLPYTNASEQFTDYQSFSESLSVKTESLNPDVRFRALTAFSIGSLPLGLSVGYGFTFSPHVFPTYTDNTLNPTLTYYGPSVKDSDVSTHRLHGSVGTLLPLSRAAELSLSVVYNGAFSDASQSYISFDTDSDGKNDKTLLYADYIVSKDPGGPATPAESYEAQDTTVETQLSFSPTLRLYVADGAELFIGGSYRILDVADRNKYQHPSYATDVEEDQSSYQQIVDGNLKGFDAVLGMGISTGAAAYMKLGLSYSRRDRTVLQDGTAIAGNSLYSSLNPDHYTELALGMDPGNESIVSLLDRPSSAIDQTVALSIGWQYLPAGAVGIFFATKISGTWNDAVYRAFNLDTRSVWEETRSSQTLQWHIEPVAGVLLRLSGTLSCAINLSAFRSTGSVSGSTETMPFNVDLQTTSTNGTRDLTNLFPNSVSIQASFILNP